MPRVMQFPGRDSGLEILRGEGGTQFASISFRLFSHSPAGHFTDWTAWRRIMGTLLLIIVILLLIGAVPTWPHARNWGYGPSGVLGAILLILLVLMLLNVVPWGMGGPVVGP